MSRLRHAAVQRSRAAGAGLIDRSQRAGSAAIALSRESAARVRDELRTTARDALTLTGGALARIRASAPEAIRLSVIPVLLLAAAVAFSLREPSPPAPPAPLPPVSAAPAKPAAPKSLAPAAPRAPAVGAVPTPRIVVQVNARPWARVWINGKDLGATPLRHRLPAGVHRLEAEFPDGRRIERQIDVSQKQRFVSLR